MQKKRPYRRPKRYRASINVVMPAETKAKIEAEADRLGVSVNEIVRQCIEKGLPALQQTGRETE